MPRMSFATLVMARMDFAGFCCKIIGLVTVSGSEIRVISGGGGLLRFEVPFRFLVMIRGLLIMMRRVVMMVRGRMFTGHARCVPHCATRRHSPASARAQRFDHSGRYRPG